ncbi:MAG: hypothetical protein LBR97_01975 [Dysgonamonadaceae bacterium]|jgi:hypothetical protein|nr:hypothetical protein [Dysgonamonadaceae bacterium]
MKKVILLFLLIGTFFCAGMAQDKIVTVNGDTISCRILDVSAGKISYEQKSKEGRTVGKFISADQVSEYIRESRLLLEQTSLKSRRSFISLPSQPFRFSIEGGYGHLLSSFTSMRNDLLNYATSKNVDQYFSGMKNDIHLGADFHVLLNEHFGVGLKYSFFASEAELTSQLPTGTYIPVYYVQREESKFYFNYIAPSLFFRQWLDKKRRFALNESLSLGCMFFRNETRGGMYSMDRNVLAKSRQFAGNLDVSLEYYLLPYLSVSANIGALYTEIKKMEVSYVYDEQLQTQTVEGGESIDMSRLNLSAGLHFYF